MKNKRFSIILFTLILFSQLMICGQESNEKKLKPEFRTVLDFYVFPYYYDFQNKMYGTSFNGSVMCGARLNQFTIGAEIFEHYVPLTEMNLSNNYKGAWNILRGTITGFYEPFKWFEIKCGIGGAWYRSAFQNDKADKYDVFGINTGGVSFIFDGMFRPWKYIQLRLMNKLDVFINQDSAMPYYTGMIRCDFHPYYEWINLSVGIGVMTWNTNGLPVNANTAILVWEAGVSIDITPARFAKKKEIKIEEKKPDDKADNKLEEKNENADIKQNEIKNFEEAKEGDVVVFDNIIFYADSKEIKPVSYPVLDEIARVLKERQDICIEIRGYTNNVNDPKSELELSGNRAEVVKEYLTKKGIDPLRMKVRGYGALNSTNSIVEANRKVEIKISDSKAF